MEAIVFSTYPDETSVLQVLLQQAGFMVRWSQSLDQAIENWPENPSDLVVIALAEEVGPSLKLVRQMRAHTAVPILVISDPVSESLQVDFLEAGVDEFILRPYSVRLLLAQIRSVMRRSGGVPFFSLPTLTQSAFVLDPSNRTVQVSGGPAKHLTHLEFRLLYTMMTHAGQVIPTERIVENVWGYAGEGNRDLVRGLVQRLRAKVEPDPRQPVYILTEAGIGYYFAMG
jgi:DNA-binding response OmpR family regulator